MKLIICYLEFALSLSEKPISWPALEFRYNFNCDSAAEGVVCVTNCNDVFDQCVDGLDTIENTDEIFECYYANLDCIDHCPCYDFCFDGCSQCPEHEFCPAACDDEEAKTCHSSCVNSMANCLDGCKEPRLDCHYKCNIENFVCTKDCPCMN
ncbi:Oidioi.mRNA.OKI2018_I69.PAR.g11965.t1.cds [Oikopleura dioica]|uniref:Oidioi.mRNA.OKI2018_I69.PAR.g11965.t1.cds n=1 Tax=Oikopleura dioica TaxID=34765 RepID=A0ABN7S161_OIKDI|nr:Oidioi.mRNA.OKI2018_I69.PAR.g11965.t1.cds [Oikopleura dioica]